MFDVGGQLGQVGVPEAVPDFSVKLHQKLFKDVKPGAKVSSKVTYKLNPDHPQPETAKLELYRETKAGKFPINPDGLVIEFNPGQEFTYDYSVTVQNADSKVVAVIRPVSVSQDKDWDNNRDEAEIKLKQTCTDVRIAKSKYAPKPRTFDIN